MRRKARTLEIGSVSSGTMRSEDLIPTFLWEVKQLRLTRAERGLVNDIERRSADNGNANDVETYWQSELADWDIDALFDILGNHVPDYCYFASHPGDGACYGVWVDFDGINEDRHFGEIVDWQNMPTGYTGYAVDVTDHGNVTLFSVSRGRSRELWSVV